MNLKRVLLIVIFVAGLAGCRNSDPTGPAVRPEGSGTFVVNEGGFGGGGNLSFYDPSDGSVSHDVVRAATPWLFPNDIVFLGGMMYVAVNGGDFIAVVDPNLDSVVAEVRFAGGTGPGLLATALGRMYTANYNGTVSAVDTAADSVVATSARVVGFPGAILARNGRIFVSDVGSWPDTGANVMVLDAQTLAVVDSVRPGGGMAGLVSAGGKIYAGAAVSRKIFRFDPVTLHIEDSVALGSQPGDLATNGASLLVLTSDAVLRIPLATFEPDTVPFASRTDGLYNYAMGYDAMTGELYVSTITTGGGTGEVSVYNPLGQRISPPFAAGTFPGAFGFFRPPSP
jgi:hypothetical protein